MGPHTIKDPWTSYTPSVTLFQTTMKLLLIAVILSVLVFTEARPDNIDYQLLDNFSSCMKAAFGQQPQHMMKRNSELVNSLLGLPQNVLRAGK